jgi:hypothetical protein
MVQAPSCGENALSLSCFIALGLSGLGLFAPPVDTNSAAPVPKTVQAQPDVQPEEAVPVEQQKPAELAASSASAPKEKPGHEIAMLDVAAMHGVSQSLAAVINESLLVELKRWSCFKSVTGGSDLRAMMNIEQQRQALGCADESCLSELGGALGVPYFFHASLAKLGSDYILTAKLLSVDDGSVLARGMQIASSTSQLKRLPEAILKELVPGAFPRAQRVAPKIDVAAEAKRARQRVQRRFALAIAGVGAVATGFGYLYNVEAQRAYDSVAEVERTSTDFNALTSASEFASVIWVSGLSGLGVSAVLALLP